MYKTNDKVIIFNFWVQYQVQLIQLMHTKPHTWLETCCLWNTNVSTGLFYSELVSKTSSSCHILHCFPIEFSNSRGWFQQIYLCCVVGCSLFDKCCQNAARKSFPHWCWERDETPRTGNVKTECSKMLNKSDLLQNYWVSAVYFNIVKWVRTSWSFLLYSPQNLQFESIFQSAVRSPAGILFSWFCLSVIGGQS